MSKLNYLFSPECIRERSTKLYNLSKSGKTHFDLHEEKLESVAELVLSVIKENYPDLNIPFHCRWNHFKTAQINYNHAIEKKIESFDKKEQARTLIDLVIISVLLDAGAGMQWSYKASNGEVLKRSEGLAIASLDLFFGYFEGKASQEKLLNFKEADLKKAFQVSESNPLFGVKGRTQLINQLGKVFKNRPGEMVDLLLEKHGEKLKARDILNFVLFNMGDIWPGRLEFEGTNLGDIWSYDLGGDDYENKLVFHKLSQWLTYSLIHPLEKVFGTIEGVDELTGLAEYRNGGLILDSGLISLKDKALENIEHHPSSELILEWRALTIVYLDKIADLVRDKLNKNSSEFPLAKVLEGGTWWAGRKLAKEKREDMGPPLKLLSDGTVF